MLEIEFRPPALPTEGALAVLAFEDGDRPELLAAVDSLLGGAALRAAEAAEFRFARGKTLVLPGPGASLSRLVLVGLGKRSELDTRGAEEAGSAAAAALRSADSAVLAADAVPGDLLAHVALGAVLGAYRFDLYRTRQKPDELPRLGALALLSDVHAQGERHWAELQAVARGVFLARDLVSEPANVLSPPVFADRIAALSALGLEIEIFDEPAMAELKFGALLGVAQGSAAGARMAVMRWNGAPGSADAPIAFIGKGVTFDTGGISIKPAGGMEDMKWDMAGAGAVVGLMAALAGRKARVNAVGVVGLVENMLSSRAQRPGDVVHSASGQTIEVINTDAEGRLVLADVMWYAQERFRPRVMIDLATLTGAIIVGLGHEYAGLFANDDSLAARLIDAGRTSGEKLWRMPLAEGYNKQLRSEIADMKNVGGRPGGSCSAAAFLQRFVHADTHWAHLDIAGMAWASKDAPGVPKGATAFGVRLLDRFVSAHYEN